MFNASVVRGATGVVVGRGINKKSFRVAKWQKWKVESGCVLLVELVVGWTEQRQEAEVGNLNF